MRDAIIRLLEPKAVLGINIFTGFISVTDAEQMLKLVLLSLSIILTLISIAVGGHKLHSLTSHKDNKSCKDSQQSQD